MKSHRFPVMMHHAWSVARSMVGAALVVAATLGIAATSPGSPIVFPATGTSALGHPVAFSAGLAIVGDTLTITLSNTSPGDTTDAADVLSSFYFDIVKGGTIRPSLSYVSGSGALFLVASGVPDAPYVYTPQTYVSGTGLSNLKAVNNGDASWQFRTMDATSAPFLGFGIGTVGNSLLSPNGFTPQIVGPPGNAMINFGIYKGADINPNGVLNYRFLVRDTATFTFSGLTGFTEANIVDDVVFGLGTNPDSTISVHLPEPAAPVGIAAGMMSGIAVATRRRRGHVSVA